jgi:hypothetical protein
MSRRYGGVEALTRLLWVDLVSRQPDLPDGLRYLLARWSDGEWTSYGFSEGVMSLVAGQGYEARLAVDQGGTLWIAFAGGGGGRT